MFDFIFYNYKNLPLEIPDPKRPGHKIPNPEIPNTSNAYQYFTDEMHLVLQDPAISKFENSWFHMFFVKAVLKINRDLSNFQLGTKTKWDALTNEDKLHLRNAIVLLIEHLFLKGDQTWQTNKNASISPISVSEINQFLKFEYSDAVISELEQVSVFFLNNVLEKREIQFEYNDKLLDYIKATFYDLFINNYPSTSGVLLSKLINSNEFKNFIKNNAFPPGSVEKTNKLKAFNSIEEKGNNQYEINKAIWEKIDEGPVILPKTNALLAFNEEEEGGINQYVINKDNKDNIGALTRQIETTENKVLSNETKIDENEVNIRNNRSNITTARTDIGRLQTNLNTTNRNVDAIEQAEQGLRTQVSANTRLSNNNKTRLDNLPSGGGDAKMKNGTLTKNVDIRITPNSETEIWGVKTGNSQKIMYTRDGILYIAEPDSQQATLTLSSGTLNLSGKRIANVGTPLIGTDAANRQYVLDSIGSIPNLKFKDNVVVKDVNWSDKANQIDLTALERDGVDVNSVHIRENKALITANVRTTSTNAREIGVLKNKTSSLTKYSDDTYSLTNLRDPTDNKDASNKEYVDNAITNIPRSTSQFENGTLTEKVDIRISGNTGDDTGELQIWNVNERRKSLAINMDAVSLTLHQPSENFPSISLKNGYVSLWNKKIRFLEAGTNEKDATNLKQVRDLIAAAKPTGDTIKEIIIEWMSNGPTFRKNTLTSTLDVSDTPKDNIVLSFGNGELPPGKYKMYVDFILDGNDLNLIPYAETQDFLMSFISIFPNANEIDDVPRWYNERIEVDKPGDVYSCLELDTIAYHNKSSKRLIYIQKSYRQLENIIGSVIYGRYSPNLRQNYKLKRMFEIDLEIMKDGEICFIQTKNINLYEGHISSTTGEPSGLSYKFDNSSTTNTFTQINCQSNKVDTLKIMFLNYVGFPTRDFDKSKIRVSKPQPGTKIWIRKID